MLHVSLAAEEIVKIGSFPVTNSLFTTWIVMLSLIGGSYALTKNFKMKPGRAQMMTELVIGGLQNFFSPISGKLASRVFPLIASIFLFVIMSNWSGLLPGVGSIGFWEKEAPEKEVITKEQSGIENTEESKTEGEKETSEAVQTEHASVNKVEVSPTTTTASVTDSEPEKHEEKEAKFLPMFRAPSADINTTLALAIIAVVVIQYYGFKLMGLGYLKRFYNFKNPIMGFVGFLELVSEFSKIISFAFRLFGNIFAGEVLLAVMSFLMPFFLPLPFIIMEIFVGFIQALVFAMLTGAFLTVAVSHGDSHEHASVAAHK